MLPILFQNHDLILYSYPLFMGLGWGVGYQLFFKFNDLKLSLAQLLFWGLFCFAWMGAKLLFLLTQNMHDSLPLATQLSFWTGGGFVFYGGVLASILFICFLFFFRFPFTQKTFYALVVSLSFGHAIGRIGCFLAGCCFGAESNWWWAVNDHGVHRHPTQILEALGLIILGFSLLKMKPSLKALQVYLISYSCLRFSLEILRGDQIRGLWYSLTPAQWISLALFIFGVFLNKINKLRVLGQKKSI